MHKTLHNHKHACYNNKNYVYDPIPFKNLLSIKIPNWNKVKQCNPCINHKPIIEYISQQNAKRQ